MSDTVFDPFNVASVDDRHAVAAELRKTCPVSMTSLGAWFVADRPGVEQALRDVYSFTGSFARTGPDDDIPEDRRLISSIPEPRHGELRRIMNSVFAPHKVAQAEGFVRSLCGRLLDDVVAAVKVAPEVPLDMVAAFADVVPPTVIAQMLGLPTEDYERFRDWTDGLLHGMEERARADLPSDPTASTPEFMAYLDAQIAQRVRVKEAGGDPGDDIIARYLKKDFGGELLSPVAIRSQLIMLVIAGNETTRNLIGNLIHRLALEPDLLAALHDDPGLIPVMVEESLRRDTPVQLLARTCMAETTIDDVSIVPGDRIVIGVASANRDERYYDEPDAFRLDRANPRDHLAFGTGPHVCPGASLGRLEGTVALEELVRRVAGLRLPDVGAFDANPVFWAHGPRSLPVLIDPR